MDYYNILKVSRSATDIDVKKSYKKLAMIWHPDKNPANRDEAESKFKLISEACDVLTDPDKRRIYDNHGEAALKSGVVPPPPPKHSHYPYASSSSSSRLNRQSSTAYHYNPRSPHDIYTEIFGHDDIETGAAVRFGRNPKKKKAPPVERPLLCSLEDLYQGVEKKLKITRTVTDHHGKSRTEEEIVTINIKPGWKKGTKVTFIEKGDQGPGVIPADIIFLIEEKPHARYIRNGNDLIINQMMTLVDALTNKILEIPTLDGRRLMVRLSGIVTPGYEHVVPNEGMPLSKEPGRKGNLKIKIIGIKYPSSLTPRQKSDLRGVLS
ncbi:unnamed protein product [Vicia faba]|uniref:J domain-containing protein n=1 Tax=Vicia faba TaxID=3906 RepID=A0AAV0ZKG2_VICFA|nr:unnamed protein product [Vicia faba]